MTSIEAANKASSGRPDYKTSSSTGSQASAGRAPTPPEGQESTASGSEPSESTATTSRTDSSAEGSEHSSTDDTSPSLSRRSSRSSKESPPKVILGGADEGVKHIDKARLDGTSGAIAGLPDASYDSDDEPEPIATDLPQPFYPASLDAQSKSDGLPRAIPAKYNLPALPRLAQTKTIDSQDAATPDNWVPRDERLVRLTGKHPFNCEAKIGTLFEQGFLTSSNLFYVRNHGAVPKVDQQMADDWTIRIHGLVKRELTLTLKELKDKFPTVTLPVTLVCAGNRRKEQNEVQKSLGFNWGAGGVSTALFTGVYLADILAYVKPCTKGKRVQRLPTFEGEEVPEGETEILRARHVIFEGGDKLPNGPYGTSQLLNRAADKTKGMLIAWAMNGLPLEPDHGYPLRLVVPGQIGGRSVKWLKEIEISHEESQHYLHFFDNRLLPTEVSPDQARNEKHWWKDPRYLINDLNINSAIAKPDHEEILNITQSPDEEVYTVRGYAYAGGGRRVTRVELSLDDGETWELSQISYPEDLYRAVCYSDPVYGSLDLTERDTCFCWCFWSYDVPVGKLKQSASISVRGMDESLALQQRDMYVNATGMMNNWWFRVVLHKSESNIRFEHPTLAGVAKGGWMQRLKEEGLDPKYPEFRTDQSTSKVKQEVKKEPKKEIKMTKDDVTRKMTLAEVAELSTEADPLFVVNGHVYAGKDFLPEHPGGPESITLVSGEDASEDFMAIHSADAKLRLAAFHIGVIEDDGQSAVAKAEDDQDEQAPIFLHKSKWKRVKLEAVTDVSYDSKLYRFRLHREDQDLGLPCGQHVYVRLRRKVKTNAGESDAIVEGEGELVQRAYTPVSTQDAKGFIDLLIKIYFPSESYPTGGKATTAFHALSIGDEIEMKGPLGSFVWEGKGMARWKGNQRKVKNLGMICGGSGITPILQVLRGVLHDKEDNDTHLWLLDGNRQFEDILCNEELEELAAAHSHRYRLHHTLTTDKHPAGWSYSKGRIDDNMLKLHLPQPSDDALILICGPEGMIEGAKKGLTRLGWDIASSLVVF
ncbi:uncharacterized protein L969DRAFT_76523 [Mixia osmundae IAM 14324]|uniref:Nitrate reductase [NADPH] n=1 Tax=Mixia osmundae (strain CBS 9802 / IAM 14324 / JCM 22182 / KY 12970) TaxID=764103 RepID=G7E7I8_MIXOS|nr:uncharacterized protein L969DRAFT_76523 [Mixia osmundae IAM 14324]KEI38400.1 hypothetical protein L969DRAFT_76523 [Mixia osmundae IAM 14324]GAA98798.1 hypothetical protein E5Q_05486 [Mixia osmundae IAM 14324]